MNAVPLEQVKSPVKTPALLRLTLAAALMAVIAAPALGADAALGPEQPLETAAGSQLAFPPTLAANQDGSFAVTWSRQQPGSNPEVVVRTGSATDVLDEPHVLGGGEYPALEGQVAPMSEGYTAIWRETIFVGGTVRVRYPLFTQLLDGEGNPQGPRRELSALSAIPRPGQGVVTWWWDKTGFRVQVLNNEGVPLASPGRLLRIKSSDEFHIVAAANGNLVAIWRTQVLRSPHWVHMGYWAQRLNPLGNPVGAPFELSPRRPKGTRDYLRAALGDDGTLAVATVTAPVATLVPRNLTLRTFDRNGRPLGGPVVIGSGIEHRNVMALAVAPDGQGLLVWREQVDDGGYTGLAQRFTRRAQPLEGPSQLHSTDNPDQYVACCGDAAWAGDSWLVTWIGRPSGDPGASDFEGAPYVRRFAPLP
ncbi:MAG TPA: hypothetical protein VMW27_14750 [Thermoanaerobaculia bacterium]|nr:hypothetical protein [Thermoanaerobaculia bacterium]